MSFAPWQKSPSWPCFYEHIGFEATELFGASGPRRPVPALLLRRNVEASADGATFCGNLGGPGDCAATALLVEVSRSRAGCMAAAWM
jgi:hypothetical protein